MAKNKAKYKKHEARLKKMKRHQEKDQKLDMESQSLP